MILKLTVNNMRLALCNVYAPNQDEPLFFSSVFDIRGETIKFSSFRKKQRVNRLKTLENELQELQDKYDINTDQNLVKDIEHLENEIRDLISYEYKGASVRARVQWPSEGEKTSKFL